MHRFVVCLGVVALLFLAVWLWESHDVIGDCERAYAEAARIRAEKAEALLSEHRSGSIPTFDAGRTTIPPKISADAIARIRGA